MARTAIRVCVFLLVVAIIGHGEVRADSPCLRECNNECLTIGGGNSFSCGVYCWTSCYYPVHGYATSDVKAQLAEMKKEIADGSTSDKQLQAELRELAAHMMETPESQLHDHEHNHAAAADKKSPMRGAGSLGAHA